MSLKNLFIFTLGLATSIGLIVFTAYTGPKDQTTEETPKPKKGQVQQIQVPKIPDSVAFAGERLPLDNFDAKERFDRELLSNCFQHAAMIMNFKLAGRYFPMIERVLAKHGLPDDLKFLAVAESNLRNLTSPAGAKGLWQFMPSTAQEYGMLVSKEVDERCDPEKATEAACMLLKRLHKDFGSWALAAAAYNMGPGGLRKNIEAQGVDAYFDLHLNTETSRYLLRIMAIKEIMQNPERYGFHFEKGDLYEPLPEGRTVPTSDLQVDWANFAKQQGITYRQLRLLNPWIMNSTLSNKTRKTFYVKIG